MTASAAFAFVTAQDQPARDTPGNPIAVELTKAKEEYQGAVQKARDRLLAAFGQQQKTLEADAKLKVAQLLKLVDQLKAERKAFEADTRSLPQSKLMQVAADDFRRTIASAKAKCIKAYEKAAEDYRAKKKDLDAAKAVLTELDEFKNGETRSQHVVGKEDSSGKLKTDRKHLDKHLKVVSLNSFYRKGALAQLPKPLTTEYFGDIVYAKEAFGRKNVICTHPVKPDTPATIQFGKITKVREGTLVLYAYSFPVPPKGGGGRVVVKIDGKETENVTVNKDDRWAEIKIPFKKQDVVVEHYPIGWNNEGMFFDYEVK